jgi:hypothetical protein
MKYKVFALAIGIILLSGLAAVGCGGEGPIATVSNHSVSPDPAVVGSPAAISVDVTNNNKGTETFTIKLWFDKGGNLVVTNTTDIILEAGATQKVAFNYTPTAAGPCQVTMGQYGGSLIGWSFNVSEAAK